MEVRSRKSLTDTIKSPEKVGKTLKKIKVLPKSCFPSESRGDPPLVGLKTTSGKNFNLFQSFSKLFWSF